MSKIIYKYPLSGHKTVIHMPFRAQVLTVDYDTEMNMSLWAVHDTDDEKGDWVDYEVLVLPTGMPTDEPLQVLGEEPRDAFSYLKTITSGPYVWHIFMRFVLYDLRKEG